MPTELFIGLMSGTSVDSIDAALIEFENDTLRIISTHEHPLPIELRNEVIELCQPGTDEINRLGRIDRKLGALFADAAIALLEKQKLAAEQISAIGSHGQTIRHHPCSDTVNSSQGFTLQIGDPNTIAAITQITTVADFRRRDVALGGQGAPLAPIFHQAMFASSSHNRAVINIGGIANISYLPIDGEPMGFDCGPGNGLMDLWIQRHRGENYDNKGQWASEGKYNTKLLTELQNEPYLELPFPKSTGRELFNEKWLNYKLSKVDISNTADIQATLLEFTARTIQAHISILPATISQIFLCGGGAYNSLLTARLKSLLQPSTIFSTSALDIAPEWVEAAAFAWLARQTLRGLPGNLPSVTGASSLSILGAVYPI